MTNLNLFSQIISKLDRTSFKKVVKEKDTDKHQKGYSSWTHFVSMLFCQFAKSQSVRDISNGLHSATGNLNHLGVRADISVRGGSFDQTLILLNGINISDPQTGHYALDLPVS